MELPTYFTDFLKEIRLQQNHIDDCKSGHQTLRERLKNDEALSPLIISDFLQGSYRRATAVRPKNGKRADVDIVVVTNLNQDDYPDPDDAMDLFEPFLKKHYDGKYRRQGRSFGIELSYVDLDMVITSAPSECDTKALLSQAVRSEDTPDDVDDWRLVKSWIALEERDSPIAQVNLAFAQKEDEWKTSPLYIPNRDTSSWEPTHPIAQMERTWEKNRICNRHYVNVVKAVKWWRRVRHADTEYPKGYPVEHLIWHCCPDGITSVADGVTRALESITAEYQSYADEEATPWLSDHGVPEHNVLARISGEDFATFHDQVSKAAETARKALDSKDKAESIEAWQELFGDKFPDPRPGESGSASQDGYSERTAVSTILGSRFA